MSLIFKFIKDNYKIILFFILLLVISYVAKQHINKKIDSLNLTIDRIEKQQIKLDTNIAHYNQEIVNVDKNIGKIKSDKTIINNLYHEKITNVDNYTDNELDSFFAVRYGYIPQQNINTKK